MNSNPNPAADFHQSRASVGSTQPASAVQPAISQSNPAPQQVNPSDYEPFAKKKLDLHVEPADPEIRKDYLHDYFVLIAPKRHSRPFDHNKIEDELIETAASPKLWEQTQVMSIKNDKGQWRVMVVENKFPSLTLDQPKAYGKQEILIDTPQASIQLGELDLDQIKTVLKGYAQRITDLKKVHDIKYVLVFKNEGRAAGASLAHAHTQIFGLPIVPDKFVEEAKTVQNYVIEHNADPYDKIIEFEQKQKVRIIEDGQQLITFCPYAPLWDMETWILPKRAVRSITELNDAELEAVAKQFQKLLGKLCEYGVSYNFYLEEGVSEHHRFCIKIRGRDVVSPMGGFEVATGMRINTIPPEASANWFRN